MNTASAPRRFSLHICHPWSGLCSMSGIRINIGTPSAFIIIGLFGGAVQKRRKDGTYGDDWAWLSIERD